MSDKGDIPGPTRSSHGPQANGGYALPHAQDEQTPRGVHLPLPGCLKRDLSDPGSLQSLQLESSSSTLPSAGEGEEATSPPRPLYNRLSTMPDPRVLEDPTTKNRPANQWTMPRSSKGAKGPRAATLFLGKDYERWQIHDRDNLGLGTKLGWNQRSGSSSAIPTSSSGGEDDDEYDDYDDYSDSYYTDDESGAATTTSSSRSVSRRSSRSRRSSTLSRRSSGTGRRSGGALGASLQPFTTTDEATVTDRIEEHLARRRKSASGNVSTIEASPPRGDASPAGSGFFRPRRFSSNGPDAAFMRHETVIGLHTPRRDSSSSFASSTGVGGRQLPAGFEKISLTPLSPATPPVQTPQLQPEQQKSSRSPVVLPSGHPSKLNTQDISQACSHSPSSHEHSPPVVLPSGHPSRLDAETISKAHSPITQPGKPTTSPLGTPSISLDEKPIQPQQQASKGKSHRELKSSDLLKRAAAAAAASASNSIEPSSESEFEENGAQKRQATSESTSSRVAELLGERQTIDASLLSHRSSSRSLASSGRSRSPAIALALARRRKPIEVEGTLYDRSGPFREGAVTDGLSVRLFSAENTGEGAGWAVDSDDDTEEQQRPHNGHVTRPIGHKSHKRTTSKHRRRHQGDEAHHRSSRRNGGVHRHEIDADKRALGKDSAIDDDEEALVEEGPTQTAIQPLINPTSTTTYLITTPDNRVASAAKLRRWAMDGEGNFYAAMEIKSVEAKIRSAMDPSEANGSHNAAYARSLAKILRQTYLDDILNEVQKAETLNPDRKSVAKLLVTSDGKYVRLEEDYPEEAFFVIAGCDDHELYPVVALVFCQSLRHIHRFHNAGWMHGDIKLENLMFDAAGNLVVIDYENANPFRVPGGDGCVALMSFDWVPPEAKAGPDGRRAGPSADLWALGANLVRAFALRDGIDDSYVREMVLESGQSRFLQYRDSLVTKNDQTAPPTSRTPNRIRSEDVDLTSLLAIENVASLPPNEQCENPLDPNSLPTPKRLLHPFARQAPHLLKFVLASCLTLSPSERNMDAELDGLNLIEQIEAEKDGATMRIAQQAVQNAIRFSGSEWVRPKLDDARRSLGLGDLEEHDGLDQL
ncbi:unnamed protein product [Sympodiomycopsis kandeliae]